MKKHSPGFLNLVEDAKKRIQEIGPQKLKQLIDSHEQVTVIDTREDRELSDGIIPTSIHLSKGIIERDIEQLIPDHNQLIVVYCSGGFRCALVADALQKMGYSQVYSLSGGLRSWLDEGYPVQK
ncbi:rhodanese-like domain-containing protein [Legionella worsleiensis]|uniref:Rhodanese domain protein n=1 Tax=Legionella worsleiensis TaxID=45076 RepID=A0A0W1A4I2_9GAMM|nr:rhodanese-like domain-containing protein [Legionella worsleiensis]KTD76169.1 rhodanese domain protein [Legionella worsleiensis]STY33255.1 rhodanese domain protein [Legionella worsleiensis]